MESPMLTRKLIFPMMSIESFGAERRCTFSTDCRWAVPCSGKKGFPVKCGRTLLSNKHSIMYTVSLCIPTDLDTKWADLPIISVIYFWYFRLSDFVAFDYSYLSRSLSSKGSTFFSEHFVLKCNFQQAQFPCRLPCHLSPWWCLLDYPRKFEVFCQSAFPFRALMLVFIFVLFLGLSQTT